MFEGWKRKRKIKRLKKRLDIYETALEDSDERATDYQSKADQAILKRNQEQAVYYRKRMMADREYQESLRTEIDNLHESLQAMEAPVVA